MPTSNIKKRANKKWNDKNKDKIKIYSYRSRAKTFIKKYAENSDLDNLGELIHEQMN